MRYQAKLTYGPWVVVDATSGVEVLRVSDDEESEWLARVCANALNREDALRVVQGDGQRAEEGSLVEPEACGPGD